MAEYQFREFLLDQMKQRDMSARQFAKFVGVDASTITRATDARNPAVPGLEFLIKLSKTTSTSLTALIGMAYPDVVAATQLSPSAQVLAQQIEKLPEDVQKSVRALIRGST